MFQFIFAIIVIWIAAIVVFEWYGLLFMAIVTLIFYITSKRAAKKAATDKSGDGDETRRNAR